MHNINEPIIEVNFLDLKRASENSVFRSECPKCKDGILLIYRDQKTGELQEFDRCIACGQQICYLDIEDLRLFDTHREHFQELWNKVVERE